MFLVPGNGNKPIFISLVLLVAWIVSTSVYASGDPKEFVGSDKCIQCHRIEFSQWKMSDHSRAMQSPDEQNVLGDFNLRRRRRIELRLTQFDDFCTNKVLGRINTAIISCRQK
ncbi:MAG: multiheme c-type cytochrome [Nitrosomonadaceae bacterium]